MCSQGARSPTFKDNIAIVICIFNWILDINNFLLEFTVQYKILEAENPGETVHIKNWQIIVWQMPKFAKVPKIIIMCQLLLVKWNQVHNLHFVSLLFIAVMIPTPLAI